MMNRFNDIPMGIKITLLLLGAGLLPLALFTWYVNHGGEEFLTQNAFHHLASIREIKQHQMKQFFHERQQNVREMGHIIETMQNEAFFKLRIAETNTRKGVVQRFDSLEKGLGHLKHHEGMGRIFSSFMEELSRTGDAQATRLAMTQKYGLELNDYLKDQGWPEMLLLNQEGDVLFAVRGGAEQGLNGMGPELVESALGYAFRAAQAGDREQEMFLADFRPFKLGDGKPRAYAVSAIPLGNGHDGYGYLAVPITGQVMDETMADRMALGETAEAYLVGRLDGVDAYRSRRHVKSGEIGQIKHGEYQVKALNGEEGEAIQIGSTGEVELVRYAPFKLHGLDWSLFVTQSANRALTPDVNQESEGFFARFARMSGYYDLLLIHKTGEVFYSVAHEKDFGADIFHGELANSHLTRLVTKAIATKEYQISDYAPYAPSGGKQAMFLAQPIVRHGEVEMVAVLQVSEAMIDGIMGDHIVTKAEGEAFLIGLQDRLISYRSNRFGESGRVGETVDQIRLLKAFEKESENLATSDAEGNVELLAYGSLDIPGLNWAVVTHLHADEVLKPLVAMHQMLLVGILALVGLVVVVALAASRSITGRLQDLTHMVTEMTTRTRLTPVVLSGKDELGRLGNAFNQMVSQQQQVVRQAHLISEGDLSQDVVPLSAEDLLGMALKQMVERLRDAARENADRIWLEEGLNRLGDAMRTHLDSPGLADAMARVLSGICGAEAAAVYLSQENEQDIKLAGRYAMESLQDFPGGFAQGEGLVGETLQEGRVRMVDHVPVEYWSIRSALGQGVPGHLLLVPFAMGEVRGVVEMGSFRPFDLRTLDFVERIRESVALTLSFSRAHQQQAALLQETRAQAQELESQQQELESQQQELEESNRHLEQQAQELEVAQSETESHNRQLELVQGELEEHIQQLEISNKYKMEFLANMSHELRTPLNSILLLSKQLMLDSGDDKRRRSLEVIHGAGTDLLDLINEILDHARIEAGKMTVQAGHVVVEELFEYLKNLFSPQRLLRCDHIWPAVRISL